MRGSSAIVLLTSVPIVAASAAAPLDGQGLEQYDYANLRLRGVGGELFLVSPNDHDEAVGFGLRLDLGFLGPHVRVMPRFAFWDSEIEEEEVERLETKLEDVVAEQNPDLPRPVIELGAIDREAYLGGVDIHWVPLITEPVRPYLGVGGEVYLLNGTGDAIEDTFVEDGLDLLTAGVSAVLGLEVQVQGGLTLYGDVRGALVADVRNVSVTAGVAYMVVP